ncbi:MAG: cysteine--tRNA ligase [Coriobacteriales bacterium]
MRIYNSQTHRKEEFVPREEGKVAMYVCGPTVYNHVHIGNARTFLSFDMIRRYLSWKGFEVTFVQNITDVDDKIIAQAGKEGVAASEVAQKYTRAFVDAMHALGVADPSVRPRATEEIPAMIDMIVRLVDSGHAYETGGSVYFAVRSFDDYGALSGRDVDEMRSGERELRGGDFGEQKRDPLDFALWKAAKPGEPSWPSPWGQGRPGWHTECAAMSHKYLGLPFDIHGGGSDLVFPHHENERAQAVCAFGSTFANYWMHGGMLTIDSEKMSKSLGNYLLAKDVVANCDVNVVRLLMLQTHYRSRLDWSEERLAEAQTSYERMQTAVRNATWAAGRMVEESSDGDASAAAALSAACDRARETFVREMDDDFNTAGALGALFTLVSDVNSFCDARASGGAPADGRALEQAVATLSELLGVLGVQLETQRAETYPPEVVDLARKVTGFSGDDAKAAVEALLDARAEARANKDWGTADAVRDGLTGLGFVIEDTPAGARVTYGG